MPTQVGPNTFFPGTSKLEHPLSAAGTSQGSCWQSCIPLWFKVSLQEQNIKMHKDAEMREDGNSGCP